MKDEGVLKGNEYKEKYEKLWISDDDVNAKFSSMILSFREVLDPNSKYSRSILSGPHYPDCIKFDYCLAWLEFPWGLK